MADSTYSEIFKNGLWTNNAGLVQLLGLCPLLAVTSNTINGLGLGLATLFTLLISNTTISLIRNLVRPEVRIPVYVLVIASAVTAIDLLLSAFFHELHGILGIFIPLIVTNCAIIGRAEAFASKTTAPRALADGFAMGLGFTVLLVALGAIREILAHGTLLANANLMFGEAAKGLEMILFQDYPGFLLAALPPGAFLALGLLIALKNVIDDRLSRPAPAKVEAVGAAAAVTE